MELEKMANRRKPLVASTIATVVVVAGALYGALLLMREDPGQAKAAQKAIRKEFRAAPMDEMAKRLRDLADERRVSVRRVKSFPFVAVCYGPRITYDSIGLLAEEAFLRLTGDTKSAKADTDRRIREMIEFSQRLIGTKKLSEAGKNSLCERRLDGYFMMGDYDGAIELLEGEGIAGRSAGWCKSTAAKLRAHKAMEARQNREAIGHLLAFIDYMLSDEMKDFEDSDPANGVIYSREWVAAKNYMRCKALAEADGDAKGASGFEAKAKPLYKAALDKAKEDDVSLDELRKEMKSYGL